MDLVVLLSNIHRAAADKEIGYEDADQTIRDLTAGLNKEVLVKISNIESALWSANLLNESKKFWHPQNHGFDHFVKGLLKGRVFNKTYNYLEDVKK